MGLRTKLIVVGLVTLLLPVAGLFYVSELENALRRGQQSALEMIAASYVAVLEKDSTVLASLGGGALPEGVGADIYLNDLPAGFNFDGYVDEQT